MRRRAFAGAAGAALFGGCVAGTPDRSAGGEDADLPDSRGPTRGESDADVDVRVVEDDPEVEYVPEEGVVRYVAKRRRSNPDATGDGDPPERDPVYETMPFGKWAARRARSAAAGAAADHVASELDVADVAGGTTSSVEGEDTVAVVSVTTVLDRSGDVVRRAGVEFEDLVAATPASAGATYVLGERELSLVTSVYARHRVLRQE